MGLGPVKAMVKVCNGPTTSEVAWAPPAKKIARKSKRIPQEFSLPGDSLQDPKACIQIATNLERWGIF
jgi:hypothetical protein